MCEIFGLCCNKAVNISFSFTELSQSHLHHDSGWGVGFYRPSNEDHPPYATIVKEPISARASTFNYFLKYGYICSNIFISHFRFATVGARVPLNTHPFQLMLDPRPESYQEKSWIFAHDGTLKGIEQDARFQAVLKPHGNTDSEHVFCYIIEHLRQAYFENGYTLSLEEKIRIIEASANAISDAYPDSLNFVISDGFRLYAYYGGYTYEEEPGMWYLTRRPPHPQLAMMDSNDGMTIQLVNKISDETVSFVATKQLKPVSEGGWKAFELNELKVFENGNIVK